MRQWKKAEPRKILIADDEQDKIRDLIDLLDGEGFQVTVMDTVQGAIDEIEEKGDRYEIIILDVIFFRKESGGKEDYDPLTAGIRYILPVIRKRKIPAIIYSAIPEAMLFSGFDKEKANLPEDRGYRVWLQKGEILPTQVLDVIEELHIDTQKTRRSGK